VRLRGLLRLRVVVLQRQQYRRVGIRLKRLLILRVIQEPMLLHVCVIELVEFLACRAGILARKLSIKGSADRVPNAQLALDAWQVGLVYLLLDECPAFTSEQLPALLLEPSVLDVARSWSSFGNKTILRSPDLLEHALRQSLDGFGQLLFVIV